MLFICVPCIPNYSFDPNHFRGPGSKCDTLIGLGVFGQCPSTYFDFSQQNSLECVQANAVIRVNKVPLGRESNPHSSDYASAVLTKNYSCFAVGTFIKLNKAPLNGGIRTHETRVSRPAAIPNLATVQLLLVPLYERCSN